MLPKLLKILESEAILFYRKEKEDILDILLFGSLLKGKENPNDMDILLIFKNTVNIDTEYALRKLFEKKTNISIQIVSKTYPTLFETLFVAKEGILANGYSLIQKKTLAEAFGFSSQVLFSYQLKGKTKSERMRFYYALYGRGTKGILDLFHAVKYTDTVILCPSSSQEKIRDFFTSWKIKYKETPLLIPQRILS